MVSEKFFIFFFFFFEKWHFSFCWRLKKIDSFGHIWFDDFWFCWSCTWSIVIFQTLDWTGWWGKQGEFRSIILMLFYYLAPLQNNSIITSRCMQLIFWDKGEVYLLDESALPVTEKERRGERKSSIGPRMKYGHANLMTLR